MSITIKFNADASGVHSAPARLPWAQCARHLGKARRHLRGGGAEKHLRQKIRAIREELHSPAWSTTFRRGWILRSRGRLIPTLGMSPASCRASPASRDSTRPPLWRGHSITLYADDVEGGRLRRHAPSVKKAPRMRGFFIEGLREWWSVFLDVAEDFREFFSVVFDELADGGIVDADEVEVIQEEITKAKALRDVPGRVVFAVATTEGVADAVRAMYHV